MVCSYSNEYLYTMNHENGENGKNSKRKRKRKNPMHIGSQKREIFRGTNGKTTNRIQNMN